MENFSLTPSANSHTYFLDESASQQDSTQASNTSLDPNRAALMDQAILSINTGVLSPLEVTESKEAPKTPLPEANAVSIISISVLGFYPLFDRLFFLCLHDVKFFLKSLSEPVDALAHGAGLLRVSFAKFTLN